MTILCVVRDKRDGSWAAFADCLITSDLEDEGQSISTPLRISYKDKSTIGFKEVALEPKVGLIAENVLFGWTGDRADAVAALNQLRSADLRTEGVEDFLLNEQNCYLHIDLNQGVPHPIRFLGPQGLIHHVHSGNYEFLFAGSGSRILNGTRFRAIHLPLGADSSNAVWAALSAVSRFLSEEIAGQDRGNQFYSLRTGGHYQMFYGSPDGIRPLRLAINHWSMNCHDEPVVNHLVLPFVQDGYECCVHLAVKEDWQMEIVDAISLCPFLESPRRSAEMEIKLVDVLKSSFTDYTFHMCWRADGHGAFFVNVQEPRFEIKSNYFEKKPHLERTTEKVRRLLIGRNDSEDNTGKPN